ncbi:MAG: hypothetical protein LBO71_09450 [Prevotellaceae bacterium]|jgi:hypothetical protein|nr:hypothetical protein [Prevotellaceae bacterium]
MKKITLTNLLWFTFSSLAIAQSSVVDYYFPTGKTAVMLMPKDEKQEIPMKYSFSSQNSSTGFLIVSNEFQGSTVSKKTTILASNGRNFKQK